VLKSNFRYIASILASFILLFISDVQAQLPDGTRLTIGTNSFFELPTTGAGAVPLAEGNDGLVLGDVVPALPGSFHLGPPDGNLDELGGIVQSFTVFNNTGTFWTEFPIADVGGGQVDMNGWRGAWGDVPIVTFDNPFGFLIVTGNTYVLDYAGNVADGPFAGLPFTLHLEGDVILPGTVLPDGARLTIGGNSYFEIPGVSPSPVPLVEGNDGLVLGDVVPALSGSFHVGLLDGNLGELGGIVQSYEFIGNTGTFWTEFPIADVGGGQVDMNGWRAAWGDSPFFSFDNPTGTLVVTGNTYVLDYQGLVNEDIFIGLPFILHLEGEVKLPVDSDGDGIPDDADNCLLIPNGAQRDTDGDLFGNYCDPDFDNNLIVNAADLAFLKINFFTTDPDADLNGDGVVNAADLAILKTMFFSPPGPSGLP